MPKRKCRLTLVQTGPASPDKEKNIRDNLRILDSLDGKTDFVLFPELSTTQYWVIEKFNRKYFAEAEGTDGETVRLFADKAKEISSYVLLPFFEKGRISGEYFSSVALLGPDGSLVSGVLSGGRKVDSYRKNHLSKEEFRDLVLDEVSYMRTGSGFPVFPTEFGKVGVLICRDRWFPESWRTLGLLGAEIVFVATATSGGLKDLFVPSMRTWARENQVFGVIANKVGTEKVGKRSATYCGLSSVVGPDAGVLGSAGDKKPEVLTVEIDLAMVEEVRQLLPNYRDRRPELYSEIVKQR